MTFVEPFPDELLSSWLMRMQPDRNAMNEPILRAYRNRAGHWRHPDVHPTRSMIAELATNTGIAPNQIAKLGLCYRYPRINPYFVAWRYVPSVYLGQDCAPALSLRITWCSRCLAEDYAGGRAAYVRADWAMAAGGFCSRHHWPLVDRCVICGSVHWAMKRSPQGPPRMCCARCRRGLERANAKALELEPAAHSLWKMIATFEAALRDALKGKLPDQFRFNHTSASQLLGETSTICLLLARARRRAGLRDEFFDRFATPALTLEDSYPDEPSCEMPLALANPPLRRCLIAICAAMLDANYGATGLCHGKLAADIWSRTVGSMALQHFIQNRRACSSTLKRKLEAARDRNEQLERISSLRDASHTYETLFQGSA